MDLNKKSIFSQLFRIFEKEFNEILQYIAPLRDNYKTTGNKIHELHMRVCSELENLMRELTESIIGNTEIENRKALKEKTYTDFSDYLYLLDKKIGLSGKKIKFLADLELNFIGTILGINDEINLQPFGKNGDLGDGNIPNWWKTYNGLKHNKFEHYTECNLGNIRDSLAAYYIILMYYIFGFNEELYILNSPYNDPTKNNAGIHKLGGIIKLKENLECELFSITSCVVESEIKEIINGVAEYQYKKDGKLEPYANGLPVNECLFYSYVNVHGQKIVKFVNKKK